MHCYICHVRRKDGGYDTGVDQCCRIDSEAASMRARKLFQSEQFEPEVHFNVADK
jgi:hypothetical protein